MKKMIKFTSLLQAKDYLKSEGYGFRERYSVKEDRCMLYRGRKGWVKVSSSKDYLSPTTMEMGTIWSIVKI
tara:strand:- start:352 stop:564 length:213 start_codon:yes stop_codon:yes gene_type:complete